MIELTNVTKSFSKLCAVDQVSATIREGLIFGLVGSNGAGKSTLLRLISGILKADSGTITLDDEDIFEHPSVKQKICFLSDSIFFFPNATAETMCRYYRMVYPDFDSATFYSLMEKFGIPKDQKLATFSKGRKKQVSLLLGICTKTQYLLCDETFDGLDPVMRQAVKSLFASELLNRNFTPIIASHSLRELEDICDQIGLIHNGHLLFTQDLDTLKCNLCKVQCVIPDPAKEEQLLSRLPILQYEKSGSLLTITARGLREDILRRVNETEPLFAEILPLSLEEIFISEMEVEGYDVKDLLFSIHTGKHPQERLASGSLHDPDVFHADTLDRDADRNASFRFRSLSESRCSLSGKSAFCRIFERVGKSSVCSSCGPARFMLCSQWIFLSSQIRRD